MPHDFPQIAPSLGSREAQRRWGVGFSVLARWCQQAGVEFATKGTAAKRPVPEDFAEIVAKLNHKQACAHFNCSSHTFYRWVSEAGVKIDRPRSYHKAEPAPASLARIAPTMTMRELVSHYRVGENKMRRWLNEAGVSSKPVPAANWRGPQRSMMPQADDSLAGRAANFLRRHFGQVFDRGKVIGRVHAGTYQLGNRVVTTDELITIAREKGFEPEAWKMVA